jgi:hypothetical protein
MIKAGVCLRSNHHPRHFFVVLTDPGPDGEILLVNFTTRLLPRDVNEEIFTNADYGLLSHPSVLAFWGTHPGASGPKLEQAIRDGHFTTLPPIPDSTLTRMIVAAKASRHLSAEQKRLLP